MDNLATLEIALHRHQKRFLIREEGISRHIILFDAHWSFS